MGQSSGLDHPDGDPMPRFVFPTLLPAVLAFVLGTVASVLVGRLDAERLESQERNQVIVELALVRARLEGAIKATFNSTDGLVNLIALQGHLDPELFDGMVQLAIRKNPHVRNVTVAPDDVVAYVHPRAGNEKVLGFAFASRPEQERTVILARERREPILVGPLDLVQGGRGLIQRAPVFRRVGGEERYWGTVSIVAHVDGLLRPAGEGLSASLRVAIRGRDGLGGEGGMVDGDPAVFDLQPQLMEVEVPGGYWQVAAIPARGWRHAAFHASPYFHSGLLISLLIALLLGLRSLHVRQIAERSAVLEREMRERERAEEALQASRTLLQALVESAGAVIYVFDGEGRLLLCNQAFEDKIGLPRERMLGMRRATFMPAEDAGRQEADDRQVMALRERASFEETSRCPEGLRHYLTVKCPVFAEGQILGVVGIATDITERKRDEEQLKLAAAILASTSEGVIITDMHGVIVAVNRAFSDITGYSEAEALGQKPSLLRSERQPPEFYQGMWTALVGSGSWQGEIWNRRKSGEAYPQWLSISSIRGDRQQLTHFVGVFSDITSLKHSQERLEHLAHFDALTDLPNRVLFQDRLAHAIDRARRYRHGIAVMLLDLDGFKNVNDSLGHPVGDRLLVQVAQRLGQCVRIEDTVARLGGDEFAVILVNMGNTADAIEVIRKILASIEQPFDLEGIGAMISTSIGVAVYPADGTTPTELVRNADAAMYGAKEAGRNTYCFYQPGMTQRAQERLHLEAALKRAIERCEFEVWFQPQISLASGRMTGAEALLRWRDPERGLVPPAEFIPLAERTGLILPIGELVLAEVATWARRWLDAGLEFGRLAINVATPQLERSDFAAVMRRTLDAFAVPAQVLEIEITESFIMSNAAKAREALAAIQALGVTTAVDDFGTGYSSLAYLKELPIDSLKIDRAFVRDLPHSSHDAVINRAIIAMAHSLGFKVIAEGIEDDAQQAWLAAEGCDEGQGYRIARPMPAAEFGEWLQDAGARSSV